MNVNRECFGGPLDGDTVSIVSSQREYNVLLASRAGPMCAWKAEEELIPARVPAPRVGVYRVGRHRNGTWMLFWRGERE